MACSIARVAGEPWSPLIIRDIWVGITRFDDIRRDLGISGKVLSERPASLVEHGVLERRAYPDRPPRHDYTLTEKGYEFCDVLLAITAWVRPARGTASGTVRGLEPAADDHRMGFRDQSRFA